MDEGDSLSIADRSNDAPHAARNTDQIERRTVCESVRRHEAKTAIAGHGSRRFGDDVRCRLRQPGENLQRARQASCVMSGKMTKPTLKLGMPLLHARETELTGRGILRLPSADLPLLFSAVFCPR